MKIGGDRIADADFLVPLSHLLAELDIETPGEVMPTIMKAHSKVAEIRDTVHSRFVTKY